MSTYAYLGPVGTFTEAALKKISTEADSRVPYANVTAALDAVRTGEAAYALVPIENSVEGVVARTLDELATGAPLVIAGEVTLPVSFALMSLPGRTEISTIATHPHAEAQCRTYIAQRYPHAELVPTTSTAAAAQALSRGEFDAAIASSAAAEHFGLTIIEENIGDNDGAVTVGAPAVSGAKVSATVLSHLKGDKVIVFKKKRRKGYQKSNGHRQQFTEIKIDSITA